MFKLLIATALATSIISTLFAANTGDILETVNQSVNNRIKYADYARWDFTYIPTTEQNASGNCSVIAYNKWLELQRTHYAKQSYIYACKLSTGEQHAFVVVKDNNTNYILDNRFKNVYKGLDNVGCADNLPLVKKRGFNAPIDKLEWMDK